MAAVYFRGLSGRSGSMEAALFRGISGRSGPMAAAYPGSRRVVDNAFRVPGFTWIKERYA